jgi:hypothetical protein
MELNGSFNLGEMRRDSNLEKTGEAKQPDWKVWEIEKFISSAGCLTSVLVSTSPQRTHYAECDNTGPFYVSTVIFFPHVKA